MNVCFSAINRRTEKFSSPSVDMKSQTSVLRHLIIRRPLQLDVFDGIYKFISVISHHFIGLAHKQGNIITHLSACYKPSTLTSME